MFLLSLRYKGYLWNFKNFYTEKAQALTESSRKDLKDDIQAGSRAVKTVPSWSGRNNTSYNNSMLFSLDDLKSPTVSSAIWIQGSRKICSYSAG